MGVDSSKDSATRYSASCKVRRTIMIDKPSGRSSSRQSTPEVLPSTNPISYPSTEHDWTLQTVFELQKTVGQLTQAVSTLTEQGRDNGKKLNQISHQIYAAGAILALTLAVGGWLLKIASDVAVSYFNSHQPQQTSAPVK
jgi:hypothetical protein